MSTGKIGYEYRDVLHIEVKLEAEIRETLERIIALAMAIADVSRS